VATAVKAAAANGLARRIRSARRAVGLAQGDFAERIGVNRNMVIRYERSQAVPRRAVLARIAREGHVTLEWLLGGADERRRGDMEWEEAVRALRAIWPNAEKWRQSWRCCGGWGESAWESPAQPVAGLPPHAAGLARRR
jgi:transcriptional regulator with XRE-family HTH domain